MYCLQSKVIGTCTHLTLFSLLYQNQDLLSQMEQMLQNSRIDSAQLHTKLDSERSQNVELEKELISVRQELNSKASKLSQGQLENAQLKREFGMVQDSLGSVEESMKKATSTIKSLQQVRRGLSVSAEESSAIVLSHGRSNARISEFSPIELLPPHC